jgi:hypothetical protein
VLEAARRRADLPVAGALAFAFAAACASGIAGLGDSDPYRHLQYARDLVHSGFRLRGAPFLPFTLLGSSGVDLWLGFHWLLVPFTPLGTLWGARLAGAAIAAFTAVALAWLLRRLGQERPAPFALVPLAISPFFAFRDHLARPTHLTVPLVLAGLAAGAGELHPGFALAAAFLHGLLHLSSPLSPFFVLLGLCGARIAGGRGSPRALLWSIAGLALAFLVRPDRAQYLTVAFLHNATTLDLARAPLPNSGLEAKPLAGENLLAETWFGLALVAAAWWASRGRTPAGSRAMRASALLAVAVVLPLSLRTARFLDYVPPLLALAAGLFWPREGLREGPRRLLPAAAALCATALAARNLSIAWEAGNSHLGPPQTYERLAEEVRARVPPRSLLFTDDTFRTAPIYASLPEYRYISMADPSLLHAADPRLFWQWHHAVHDATYCRARRCDGAPSGSEAVAEAIRGFSSEWIVTDVSPHPSAMVRAMEAAPERFELVAGATAQGFGLALWHLKPAPPGSAVASPLARSGG